MILLNNILEASSDDIKKGAEAKAIVKYVSSQIENYTKDTYVIRKIKNGYSIRYKDLTINILDTVNLSGYAAFIPSTNTINVNNADFNNEGVKYPEVHLFHEIIHYLDSKVFKGDIKKSAAKTMDKIKQGNHAAYLNSPLEFNAHFFEYFLPRILLNIQKETIDPNKSFNDFIADINKTEDFQGFYPNLEPKFKQKLLKRLAGLWQELKNPTTAKELATANISNIENEKKRYTGLQKIWDKLGDY